MNPSERKQQLVAQAALHRQRMSQASHAVTAGLHPGALIKGVGGLALAGLALWRNKKSGAAPAGVAALLPLAAPLALRAMSRLSHLKAPGSTARKLLAVGVIGAVAAFAFKRKAKRGAKRNKPIPA